MFAYPCAFIFSSIFAHVNIHTHTYGSNAFIRSFTCMNKQMHFWRFCIYRQTCKYSHT